MFMMCLLLSCLLAPHGVPLFVKDYRGAGADSSLFVMSLYLKNAH